MTPRKQLTVELGERSYPIYIGEDIIQDIGSLYLECRIPIKSPHMVVSDESVAPHYLPGVTASLEAAGYTVVSASVPSGEKSKSLHMLERLVTAALEGGLDRRSSIIALGGGVVGDLAGFAAASYMRGIQFVQVPTTILAHDSSVGGKVAVNHPLAKNIIGAFHQPEFVLYDIATLKTLPEREIKAGFAEVVKHGLIWDKQFADWIYDHAEQLLSLDPEALTHALYEGCKIKSIVVSQDEREGGWRAILNLGHTIGHALEAVSQYGELLHGEAISIGMIGAAKLAGRFGYPDHIYTVTKQMLLKFGLPVKLPDHYDTDAVMEAMAHDKKFKEGSMTFVVPTDIGKVEIKNNVPAAWVKDIVEQLKREE